MKSAKDLIDRAIDNLPVEGLPYVGSFFQFIKNKQFEKRLNLIEPRIKDILNLISIEDYEYFCEKIGCMTLQKIFMDEEDDKAEYYILGFENCVKEEIKDEDKVITLFDIISELRMIDIKRLTFLYDYSKGKKRSFEITEDMTHYIRYVDEKLERLGLIKKEIIECIEMDTDLDKVVVMSITQDVLKFMGHV
ncbi:hypothetical protein BEP19_04805 [Ammoniphilus oxalaticus]|uniref:Uncharacterized protein n=1 Tax=Ammoniphilus oxalaticus TaxID=66863 RepID=A0A419SM47_9BACL|nr:hypothetical protein [Ammoniphilus oxalaticus]RKD25139.1 hypothetical protein BEP19_04805 [Ammoniphilus oxalaticus]